MRRWAANDRTIMSYICNNKNSNTEKVEVHFRKSITTHLRPHLPPVSFDQEFFFSLSDKLETINAQPTQQNNIVYKLWIFTHYFWCNEYYPVPYCGTLYYYRRKLLCALCGHLHRLTWERAAACVCVCVCKFNAHFHITRPNQRIIIIIISEGKDQHHGK